MSDIKVYPPGKGLAGELRLPGDKSISHRAVLLAGMAEGTSRLGGFSPSQDCARTVSALEAAGVEVLRQGEALTVRGRPPASWREASDTLDLGNSGTSMRLLAGVLAGARGFWVLSGDASLRRRPMGRVVRPLRSMGASLDGRGEGNFAPLAIRGKELEGREFSLEVASAQVKSCLLLAGLLARGETWVEEPLATRDHTERLLPLLGVNVERRGRAAGVSGPVHLHPFTLEVPGDPSAAAFFVVAASLVPGSRICLRGVGLNPHRTGFLRVLSRMGARFRVIRESGGVEPVGDLEVESANLQATAVTPEEVPSLIDELPVLAVAAAGARGTTRVAGAEELRVKESDRLAACAQELSRLGARIEERRDGWIIEGPALWRGGTVSSWGDHRLAMAWAIAALVASDPVTIQGAEAVAVSYPGFFADLRALGVRVEGGET